MKKSESLTHQIPNNHILEKMNSLQKKCVFCYKKLELEFGRKRAQNKRIKVSKICLSYTVFTFHTLLILIRYVLKLFPFIIRN